MHGHGSAVHLGQPADEREPDTETSLRALRLRMHLREQLEDPRQQLRRNADARVGDLDHRVLALAPDAQPDPAAGIHELRGVVQDVGDHLHEARLVALDADQLVRQIELERVPMRVDRRPRRLDRARHDRTDEHRLELQRDHAARNARDIQQVVDQVHEMLDLPLDHVSAHARDAARPAP